MELSINDPEAANYDVIDLNTNQRIHLVQFADDIKGVYIVLVKDEQGKFILEKDNLGNENPKVEMKTGNIKLVRREVPLK